MGAAMGLRRCQGVDGAVLGTDAPRYAAGKEEAPGWRELGASSVLRGGRDSKAPDEVSAGEHSRALVSEDGAFGLRAVPPDEPTCTLVSGSCTNVPNEAIPDGEAPETAANPADAISAALAAAQRAWDLEHDRRALCCALLDLLRRLDAAA